MALAILVLATSAHGRVVAQDAEAEAPSAAAQVDALHSAALARLPEIDREIEASLTQARAACETPWAGARLNKAADPYSLALHQEGRSRRDETAAAMRNTQKGVAYFRLLNNKLLERWSKLDENLAMSRARLVDSLRGLESLREDLESEPPSRKTRDTLAVELAEMWSTLKAIEGAIRRGNEMIAEHREEWSELAEQARAADPGALELQPRTRAKGELMLAEFTAMEESFDALSGSAEKHLEALQGAITPLADQVDALRKIYKEPRR